MTLPGKPTTPATGRTLVLDIEADGLLFQQGSKREATQFWCFAVADMETGEEFYWGPEEIEEGLRWLQDAKELIAHNGNGFDFPAIPKLYPWYRTSARLLDSLVLCKILWPAEVLVGPDLARIRSGKMPGQYLKRQSLAAWGYRTGTYKGEYTGGFDAWSPAMADYLMGDIRATVALWKLIKTKLTAPLVWPDRVVDEEMAMSRICLEQEWGGVSFDKPKAHALARHLANSKAELEAKLVDIFGSWWQASEEQDPAIDRDVKLAGFEDVVIPRVSEKTGKALAPYVGPPKAEYRKGQPYVNIEWVTFNPSSRDHLGQRLCEVYGWTPKKFGKDGKPSVDETVLEAIPDAVMPADVRKSVLDYFVVTKTLAMLAGGRQAWIALVDDATGKIHGRIDPQATITRRASHSKPNRSQTPGVRKEKVVVDGVTKEVPLLGLAGRYGWECRDLWVADPGWELTGTDASALELILLGHYLQPLDGGAFSERVCDPTRDPHREHAEIAGMLRADAKTAIYLRIFGGSAFKLSLDIDIADDEILPNLGYRGLPMLLSSLEKRFDADFVLRLDDRQRAKIAKARQIILKLEQGIPGLKKISENVSKAAAQGWLKAIDGSRIIVRKDYAALNALLQSAGAIACKRWGVLLERALQAQGLRPWRPFTPDREYDYRMVGWYHDEYSYTHRPGLGPIIAETAERCLVEAGESLGLRGRFRSDAKTGLSWAETH